MDCNSQINRYHFLSSNMPIENFYQSIQLFMLPGKMLETFALTQAQYSIETAAIQTSNLLEGMDANLSATVSEMDNSLVFPFDVMDYVSRTTSDNWRVLLGGKTTAELKLVEQVESQETLFSRIEKQLKKENAVLTQSLTEKERRLTSQVAESEKARKAKLSAQRAQRKLKAELEKSNDQLAVFRAECETYTERYDQQLSDNSVLKTANKHLELELAEARQESILQKNDSEQMAREVEALTTEQSKLIAEKDGLQKRIEELQHQLEHSSNYTE
ncbi:hypothetical protein BIT28_15625 [Photobacterium proteolyticum]|uniref:Uncharacterized protein n=1 Tax=Photobacterium proteolyticum TaxID=1903952 RepID=A0A1Q9GZ14_9GAMM|nr:hypothetical protein [Photobacterium proteolyticum]OLQ80505.1 hypothetical protein BIT28_15625 [Photobacterium proteolyticum]